MLSNHTVGPVLTNLAVARQVIRASEGARNAVSPFVWPAPQQLSLRATVGSPYSALGSIKHVEEHARLHYPETG